MYPLIDGLAGFYYVADPDMQVYDLRSEQGKKALETTSQTIAYEVLRIRKSRPLAWNLHVQRLQSSARAAGLPVPTEERLLTLSRLLYQADPQPASNLRWVLTPFCLWAHYSTFYYPGREQQEKGVPSLILAWERVQPQLKLIRSDYKKAVASAFARQTPFGAPFEVLLQDRRGRLTEGSRSNLYFIKNHVLYSAPDTEILLGTSRKILLPLLSAVGFDYSEDLPTWEEIQYEGGFGALLSSSPIDLLAISSIEGMSMTSPKENGIIELSAAYQKELDRLALQLPSLEVTK